MKDLLENAFAGERFTLTVADISNRVDRARRRRLALAGASVVIVSALGAFAAQPSPSPQPVASPSPSSQIDWDRLQQQCDRGFLVHNGVRLGPGRVIARQETGGIGVLIYTDDLVVTVCSGSGGLIINALREPVTGNFSIPDFASGMDSQGILAVAGRMPANAENVEVLLRDGRVYQARWAEGVFYVADAVHGDRPADDGSDVVVRVTYADQVILGQSIRRKQSCGDAINALPIPGPKNAAPPVRFAYDLGDGSSETLYGDETVLIRCLETPQSLVIDATYHPGGRRPEVLSHVSSGHGYTFGWAGFEAASGHVTLQGGRIVNLSIKDGFYAAQWVAADDTEVPIGTVLFGPNGERQ